jgi:hypothetical protein
MAECLYKPPLSSSKNFFLQTSVVGPEQKFNPPVPDSRVWG